LGHDVIEHSTEESAPARVVDLMEALSASIKASSGRSAAATSTKKVTAKATPITKAQKAAKTPAKAKPASKAAGRRAS
jgi:hypothetical protein